jgi:hypothetical protein
MAKFEELVGKTLTCIKRCTLDRSGNDALVFTTEHGAIYTMAHYQDCCESVVIDEIIGDLDDLLHTPILVAEERTSQYRSIEDQVFDRLIGKERDSEESETWTFYEVRTIKGSVTIRWHGRSNGYYSESVDFHEELDRYRWEEE